jgi:CO/xanthine dehydrogenase Mo-binding subunit
VSAKRGSPSSARASREGCQGEVWHLKYPVDFRCPASLTEDPAQHTAARSHSQDRRLAEALPGYLGIVTHEDAPDLDWHGVWLNYIGHIFDGVARFVGDEIAAVAASTREVAEQALELIEVEYEPLPAVFDPDEALLPDAPQVQAAGNAREPNVYEWGDLEEGKRAPIHRDGRREVGSQQMAPIGRNAAIAEWNGGKVTLYTGSQSPSEVRDGLAQAFGIPQSKTRVVALPLGASFGEFWSNNFMMIALLAKRAPPGEDRAHQRGVHGLRQGRHKEHCAPVWLHQGR